MNLTLIPPGRFDALVQGVAERVTARCPPVVANDPERAAPQERIEEILDECIAKSLELLPTESGIGFFGRARLKSALKWGLREFGYEEKFADLAAEKVIQQLARRRA